jgi:hypothetical protein
LTSVKEFAAGVSLRNNLGEGVEHVGKAPDLDGTVGSGWVGGSGAAAGTEGFCLEGSVPTWLALRPSCLGLAVNGMIR